MNARHLSRKTAEVLREVAFEGHTIAVEHCGRVIGFLVPVGDRVPIRRGRKWSYEVPETEPLLELNEVERSIVATIYRIGKAVPDQLIGDNDLVAVLTALSRLEITRPPLLKGTWGSYDLTPAGLRHAEELGL